MTKTASRLMRPLAALCLHTLILAGSAQAQTAVVSPALEAHMEAIEALTRQIRGLDELTPVVRAFPTRADLQDYLLKTLDAQLDEEAARVETQFYVAFDLLPADIDLRQAYLTLLSAQVAGFYDVETKTMNVILLTGGKLGDSLPLLEQIIYSHEYVHALQDQHFGLLKIGLNPEQLDITGDPLLALQALVEGDATAVMNQYTMLASQQNPVGALAELLVRGMQAGALTLPPGTPPILSAELLFPYYEGQDFVLALYQQGGWERVNQAYGDLPQSTEQILHPQHYLDGDDPVAVTLDADGSLGDGWSLVMDRTMGEFYLRQYLRTRLPSGQANAAAEGWAGDRFHIYYRDQDDARAWVLKLVWDSAADAAEFTTAYTAFGDARFGTPSEAVEGARCWSGDAESLCLAAADADLIAYGPTRDLALTLIAAQG